MIQKSVLSAFTFVLAGFLFSSGEAHAFARKVEVTTTQFTIGNPNFSGTGCPVGTASATLSPDKTTLSVIFDEFKIEDPDYNGLSKNCLMTIPISVPTGFRVIVARADFKGYAFQPMDGFTQFKAQMTLRDRKGVRQTIKTEKTIWDEFDSEFDVTLMNEAQPMSSGCGGAMSLETSLYLSAGSNQAGDSTFAQVDSMDVTSRNDLKFKLYTVSCR